MPADCVILAPGESLTTEQVDSVRQWRTNGGTVIAVSDAFKCAPWADALVANDLIWWNNRPEAHAFAGGKFSTNEIPGIEKVPSDRPYINKGTNSGALSLYVAKRMGAKRILLVGFDHKGSHFCGPYAAPLKNTPPARWSLFSTYFESVAEMMRADGVEVLNCTPGSALTCFPFSALDKELAC
jgi:hypothetical protein